MVMAIDSALRFSDITFIRNFEHCWSDSHSEDNNELSIVGMPARIFESSLGLD